METIKARDTHETDTVSKVMATMMKGGCPWSYPCQLTVLILTMCSDYYNAGQGGYAQDGQYYNDGRGGYDDDYYNDQYYGR